MTRDELIAALQALPNVDVCVTTDPNRETLLATQVSVVDMDNYGPNIVILGVEAVDLFVPDILPPGHLPSDPL